jgi:ubiquitin-like protein Pup
MSQETKYRTTETSHEESITDEEIAAAKAVGAAATSEVEVDDLDALLDEIDSILEPDAEKQVKDYLQVGGQ